jgi:predicted TIM-barrel fold metal-dependent hydrolase
MTAWHAIDMHVHLATAEWLEGSMGPYRPSMERYFGRSIPAAASVDAMAEYYRGLGVHAVLLGWDAERATGRPGVSNERIAAIVRDHPDVFTGFASVDPLRPDVVDRMRRARDLGLAGFKIHPSMQGFDPAEAGADAFFAEADRLGLPILSHAGTSGVGAGMPGGQGIRLEPAHPLRLDGRAADHPRLRFLLAHVGWPWHLDALAMALHKRNVFIDIFGWKYRYLPPEVLREMRTRLRRQFCFGTDYPMFEVAEQLAEVDRLDLPEEPRRRLLRLNAEQYLGWQPLD